jgi:hypothetical protein
MKKKIFYTFTSIILVMLLGLTGCINAFNPDFGIAEGKGLVKLQLGAAAGRTLLPETFSFEFFTLTFTPEGDGDATVLTQDNADLAEFLELDAGKYTLDVEMFAEEDDEDPVAWAKDIDVNIPDGGKVDIPVFLTFDVTDGEGTFEWDIDVGDFDYDFFEIELLFLADGETE